MPTRDEMIAALKAQDQQFSPAPSREEMIAALREADGKPSSSAVVAGVRNYVQGASGNLSDELAGYVEAGGRALGVEGAGGPMKDIRFAEGGPTIDSEKLREAYEAGRDHEREALKRDAKERPGLATTTQLLGAVTSPINKAVGGMSLAKGGAVLGGVSGFGGSEGDSLGEVLIDTATGTAIGGGVGKAVDKAAPLVQKGIEKGSAVAKDLAERFSARALGAERATVKKLGMDKIKNIGRQALDEGVLSPLASTDDMIARNSAVKEKGALKMNEAYKAIDDAGASTFNPLETASKVDKEIGGFYRSPINRGETNQLENTLESILMRGEKNISLKEAQTLKQELGKVANWKNNLNITDKERMAREAYKIVSKDIDEAAAAGSKAIKIESVVKKLGEGKSLYSNSKGAEELLANKYAREQGNKLVGLTDWGAAGAGSAAGASIPGTVAAVGLKKGLERFGSQNAALGLDKISKVLMKSPKISQIAKSNPGVVQAIVSRFERNSSSLPRAADSGEKSAEYKLKGHDKWALDGFVRIAEHDESFAKDADLVEKILSSPKGKQLFIAASDLKPGSRAMADIVSKLKNISKEQP